MKDEELACELDAVDEAFADLLKEYEQCIATDQATPRARRLTHDIIEKVRHTLDKVAFRIWEKQVAPGLDKKAREKVRLYFPIRDAEFKFQGAIGGPNGLQPFFDTNDDFRASLLALQPFNDRTNLWLLTLVKLSNRKHTRLAMQKVAAPHLQLRFNVLPGEHFDGRITNVQVEGLEIPGLGRVPGRLRVEGGLRNPATGDYDLPLPEDIGKLTPWYSLQIEGYGEDAVEFCDLARQRVRQIVEDFERFF